jgi:voltage-gated potassium channel Kch
VPDQPVTKSATSSKPTIAHRLRYGFDAALSRGPSVVITWLGLLTLAVIVVTASILTVFQMTGVGGDRDKSLSFPEAMWESLTRVLDAGTFVGEVGWPTRLVGLFVTICGVFIAGSLIGLIASAVDQRITELRKGRSRVIDSGHTLILGWSSRVPAIVSELVIANESRKDAAVVILADVEKTEMEETLRQLVPQSKTTRMVCRSGVPWTAANLEMVNFDRARSIVIVGGGQDTVTVKALLGLRAARGADGGAAHIVAEVVDADTAQSLRSLIGGGLVTVSSENVVAELTAQACRQRGLSGVFRELLDFDGDELYFAPFPDLVGRTYAAIQLAFERCAVIGILDMTGTVVLNPAPATVFGAHDQLIAIAEDDSLFVPSPISVTPVVRPMVAPSTDARERRIVITGWSTLGPRVITELDEFLDARTTIELMLDPELVDVDAIRKEVSTRNVRLDISELGGGPEFVAAHAARRSFHEVIVLGYRNVLEDDEADARTLLTLLAFNQVRQADDVGPVRIVAEMLDQRNAPLAEATGVDDFVVSDELTSLMLAQLSERQELSQVFLDLFDRDGCSIELRAAPIYGAHQATSFADVVATASARGDSAIGYRLASSGKVIVNPPKSAALSLTEVDEILVIAPGLSAAPAREAIASHDEALDEAIGIASSD